MVITDPSSLRSTWCASEKLRLICLESLQLHLQPPEFPEQPCLFGLPFLLVLAFLDLGVQLVGGVLQQGLPLAYLDRGNDRVSAQLLERLAATDRLHGDPGFELVTVVAALAH